MGCQESLPAKYRRNGFSGIMAASHDDDWGDIQAWSSYNLNEDKEDNEVAIKHPPMLFYGPLAGYEQDYSRHIPIIGFGWDRKKRMKYTLSVAGTRLYNMPSTR